MHLPAGEAADSRRRLNGNAPRHKHRREAIYSTPEDFIPQWPPVWVLSNSSAIVGNGRPAPTPAIRDTRPSPVHWSKTTASSCPSDGLARGVLRHPRESSAGDLSQFLSTHDSLAVHWNTFGRLKASGNHQAAMQSSEENAL